MIASDSKTKKGSEEPLFDRTRRVLVSNQAHTLSVVVDRVAAEVLHHEHLSGARCVAQRPELLWHPRDRVHGYLPCLPSIGAGCA